MERIVEMKFRALLEEFSAAYGTTYDLVYDAAYHVVLNDPSVTDISREVIRRAFGAGHLVELSRSSMGAEDFGSYLQYIPGVYVKVGVAPRNGELHNCYFDFNDASLPYGVRYLVEWSLAALKELA